MGRKAIPNQAFADAIERLGGQSATGRFLRRPQQTINARLHAGLPLWDVDVLKVEEATGISRHDLRPDLYPRETSQRHAAGLDSLGAAR